MAYDTRQKTSQRQGYDITGKMLRDYKLKSGTDPLNKSAGRSEQMIREYGSNNMGQAVATPTPPPQVATPLRDEASAMRDRLRMQITSEQQKLLAGRRTGDIARGSGTDTDSLTNIAALRRELAGYDRAATPGQRPNSPEANFMAGRDVAGQAAKIMQGDLAAMEQKVYTMPPGPMRDAEVEKLRAFKSKTNEQFVKGNVLRPEDTGPPVPGSSSTDYADAMATAEGQTASQIAAAGRDYDRRQNVLGFTKELTANRMSEEQRAKDAKTAQYEAGLAEVRRPQDEFRLRQDATNAEIRAREAAVKEAERKAAGEDMLTSEKIANARWDRDPQNPANRKTFAEASVLDAQATREIQRMKNPNPSTKEEMETAMVGREFNTQQVGLTPQLEATAMQAASALASEMGGIGNDRYIGSMFTGNAEGGIKATAQMASFAQALEDLAKTDPQAAKNKARDFLANMPKRAAGTSQHAGGAGANTGLMLGGIAAAPFTFGLSLLGTLAGAIQEGQQFYNASDKAKVVADLNRTRDILERLTQ